MNWGYPYIGKWGHDLSVNIPEIMWIITINSILPPILFNKHNSQLPVHNESKHNLYFISHVDKNTKNESPRACALINHELVKKKDSQVIGKWRWNARIGCD